MQRRKMVVYGRVQGVGFRYHTASCARDRDLTGLVKNQLDGSVRIEAQGAPATVAAFFAAVLDDPPGRVDRNLVSDEPVRDGETEFRIRF